MASTSSVLRSAASAALKAREFEDAQTAYQWQNSTKTYAELVSYEKYLEGRRRTATDPTDQLGYQKKIDSARSGYISNEVQRQSINVLEGRTSNTEKYNRMTDLYYFAAQSGQLDLAQSLRSRIDSLSVTIQNEQLSSLVGNREALNEATKDLDNQVRDAVAQIENDANYALERYQLLGAAGFEKEQGIDLFSMLTNMVVGPDAAHPGLVQIYEQAMRVTPDPAKQRDYQVKFNNLANGGKTGIRLPGVGDVSYKDLADQAYAYSIGQTLFDTIQTAEGVKFTRNETTGYTWGRDEQGNYRLMPVYNPDQDFTSKVKDGGENLSYQDLLENSGFEVIKGSDDTLVVRNSGQFDIAGIPRGQQVQLYVDANGNLQTINGNSAYTLGFDQAGKFTGINAETPNPINLLPSGDRRFSRFNNRYFAEQEKKGLLNLSSLPAGAIGLIDTTSQFARPMEAGPLARPQPVLQQSQSAIPRPVAPSGVQQGAVSPIGLPANTRINIAKPQPLPRITVAKPKPLPTLRVAKPEPQTRLSVGKPVTNPEIRVL